MARNSGITRKLLDKMLDESPYYQKHPEIKARLEADLARSPKPLKKRDEPGTLVSKKQSQAGMVHIPGPVHCRILRIVGKRSKVYDDDNYSGGLKSCRDAVSSALGLKGDSEENGITFEYVQKVDETQTTHMEIEIYNV